MAAGRRNNLQKKNRSGRQVILVGRPAPALLQARFPVFGRHDNNMPSPALFSEPAPTRHNACGPNNVNKPKSRRNTKQCLLLGRHSGAGRSPVVYRIHSRPAGMTTWVIPASVIRAIRLTPRPAFLSRLFLTPHCHLHPFRKSLINPSTRLSSYCNLRALAYRDVGRSARSAEPLSSPKTEPMDLFKASYILKLSLSSAPDKIPGHEYQNLRSEDIYHGR